VVVQKYYIFIITQYCQNGILSGTNLNFYLLLEIVLYSINLYERSRQNTRSSLLSAQLAELIV